MVRNDAHHDEAKGFVRDWIERDGLFVLTDLVFAETMTLTKARLGASVALEVGRELRQNRAYSWLRLGLEGERATWAAFQRYEDKAWSYTDCALLAVARRERIPQIFAFDRHFDQMPGLERLP